MQMYVAAAVIPLVKVTTFDIHARHLDEFGKVGCYDGKAISTELGNHFDYSIGFKLALNRAIRKALAAQGLNDVWDETYHAKKHRQRRYCLEVGPNALGERVIRAFKSHNTNGLVPLSLPQSDDDDYRKIRGVAPLSMLPRIVAHAVAQRAAVDLKLGFRSSLTLHYGKTNCVDGRMGWTMVHYWPKSTGEGEPDDFDMKEWVMSESEHPAEVFTAKAKQLLRLE